MVELILRAETYLSDRASGIPKSSRLIFAFGFLVALGSCLTAANLDLPIVRNALCYAKASLGILAHHYDIVFIARDEAWTSGKPILFSLIAAPFVSLFDINAGTMIASGAGTVSFLCTAVLACYRLNRHIGLSQNLLTLELVLVGFNPLVIYQFWSAYPDTLFSSFILISFVLIDIIATEPERDTRLQILGLFFSISLAIYTKLYGAILLLICPLYLLLHARQWLHRASLPFAKIVTLVAVFSLIAAMLVAARMNQNPLLILSDGAGFGSFMNGLTEPGSGDVMGSLAIMAFALLLNAHFALLFLLKRNASILLDIPTLLFAVIFLGGLLFFKGTDKNMRYFLPVFPFIAVALAAAAQSVTRKRLVLIVYGIASSILIAIFNVAPVGVAVEPIVYKFIRHYPETAAWLDNFRLPVQMDVRKRIDAINADIPDGSTLYWASDYYKTATHGLAYHLGVKRSITVRYVSNVTDISSATGPVFVVEFSSQPPSDTLSRTPGWASATLVNYGLFRLSPKDI
jgi:hypothetical protein